MPLRDLRLARFGDNMRDVAVTEGDKVETQLRFGVSVNTYGVNDLVTVVDSVTQEEIDKLVEEYADLYRIAPELHPGGERHDALRYGARIEAGLRTFLEDGGFGAFTPNFEDLGGLRQLPGLGDRRRRARRLRRDDRDRDRGHRRGHHAPQLPARAPVERGVPPAGCGDLTASAVAHRRQHELEEQEQGDEQQDDEQDELHG